MRRYLAALVFILFSFSAEAAISASSYVVLDSDNKVLLQKNPDEIRPIASITKILVLTATPWSWPSNYLITQGDRDLLKHTRLRLKLNTVYTGHDLLSYSLLPSNNEAIKTLVRTSGTEAIISLVNSKFVGTNTVIVEPSGLDYRNKSTALDLAKYALTVSETEAAKLSINSKVLAAGSMIKSTNPLLTAPGWAFKLSKTGYIKESGGCVLSVLKIKDKTYSIAILGSADVNSRWRDLVEIRRTLNINDDKFYEPLVRQARIVKSRVKKIRK